MTELTVLPNRGVIEVSGEDRVAFLQGLVSNDVAAAVPGHAVWTALLTPQGRWLADFFVLADTDRLLLDCERDSLPMLLARLGRFRLRAKAVLGDVSERCVVHVAWDGAPVLPAGVLAAADPRLPEAGWRVLAPAGLPANASPAQWDLHRLALGLPEAADMEREKTLLLEAGFDELHGVSWDKGCYMGQELTARTRYRGLVKRRLVPVAVAGPLPAPGSAILGDGGEVGTMRSGRDGIGLATLRLEALGAAPLACGEARLTPRVPGWMKLA